jgi:exopolysaccharide production protein ExoY
VLSVRRFCCIRGMWQGMRGGAGQLGHIQAYAQFGKRILDLTVVLALAWLVMVVVALCAAIAALDGGWPFYGHRRVGLNGKEFRCWKIRSMVVDSQARLQAHLDADPAARWEWDTTRKLKSDPRITRFGRFLRRSSLDELPQLLNVLLGEMSIVGPRPVPRDELGLYGAGSHAYLALRPGITGLWQVSGRNDVSYATRVALDQQYCDTHSLGLDLRIIVKTLGVVFGRNGH